MEAPRCHIHREHRMGTISSWGDGKETIQSYSWKIKVSWRGDVHMQIA